MKVAIGIIGTFGLLCFSTALLCRHWAVFSQAAIGGHAGDFQVAGSFFLTVELWLMRRLKAKASSAL